MKKIIMLIQSLVFVLLVSCGSSSGGSGETVQTIDTLSLQEARQLQYTYTQGVSDNLVVSSDPQRVSSSGSASVHSVETHHSLVQRALGRYFGESASQADAQSARSVVFEGRTYTKTSPISSQDTHTYRFELFDATEGRLEFFELQLMSSGNVVSTINVGAVMSNISAIDHGSYTSGSLDSDLYVDVLVTETNPLDDSAIVVEADLFGDLRMDFVLYDFVSLPPNGTYSYSGSIFLGLGVSYLQSGNTLFSLFVDAQLPVSGLISDDFDFSDVQMTVYRSSAREVVIGVIQPHAVTGDPIIYVYDEDRNLVELDSYITGLESI